VIATFELKNYTVTVIPGSNGDGSGALTTAINGAASGGSCQ
jgi:hypothetical protein